MSYIDISLWLVVVIAIVPASCFIIIVLKILVYFPIIDQQHSGFSLYIAHLQHVFYYLNDTCVSHYRLSKNLSWVCMMKKPQLHSTRIFLTFLHWKILVQKMHLKGMIVSPCNKVCVRETSIVVKVKQRKGSNHHISFLFVVFEQVSCSSVYKWKYMRSYKWAPRNWGMVKE